MALRAATTSLRMPRVLGMGESGPDPHSFIHAASEVFGELAKEVAIYRGAGLVGFDRDPDWLFRSDRVPGAEAAGRGAGERRVFLTSEPLQLSAVRKLPSGSHFHYVQTFSK